MSEKQSIPPSIRFTWAGYTGERAISAPKAEQLRRWLENDAATAQALADRVREALRSGDPINLSREERAVLRNALRVAQTDPARVLRSALESVRRDEEDEIR